MFFLTFCSCTNSVRNKSSAIEINDPLSKLNDTISCESTIDTFGDVRLNGISLRNGAKQSFLKKFGKPDSIENGYHHFGKNSLVFDGKELVAVDIFDKQFTLSDFINVGDSLNKIIAKYPCFIKKASPDTLSGKWLGSVQFFEKTKSNRLRVFLTARL